MITHSHKQIKKHLSTFLHLHLHSPTPLERGSAPDDESKIVGTELAVILWSICVCVSGAGQDCAAVYTRLEALFAESETFEFGEFVALAGAAVTIISIVLGREEGKGNVLYSGIFQYHAPIRLMKIRGILWIIAINVHHIIFQRPGIATFVMYEARIVVSFV